MSEVTSYKTVATISEGLYKEKMSKFISFAIPVFTVDEAMALVEEYRNKYHDARHVCWGYRVGATGEFTRSSDNGEPSGTAGKPIVGQMLSNEITNVLIVVIRYFGGIKLGTGGLIVAYKEAALDAIRNNIIVERTIERQLFVEFDYIDMEGVMRLMKEKEDCIRVGERTFDNRCSISFHVSLEFADEVIGKLEKLSSVKITDKGLSF
jgi:uncharacterized YigZ family protein